MSWSRVLAACFVTFSCSFLVPGYQALRPAMLDEGVFSDQCEPGVTKCREQELRLDLMFTLSISGLNGMSPFAGAFVGRFGPRSTCLFGLLVSTIGALLFALGSQSFSFGWMLGFIMMGISGPFVLFPMFSLTSSIPNRAGTIISFLIASVDGSSAMFLFMALIHEHASVSLRSIFLCFMIFPVVSAFISLWIFKAPAPVCDESSECEANDELVLNIADDSAEYGTNSPNENNKVVPHTWTTTQALRTPGFFATTVFMCVFMTAKYFYIGSVNTQILWVTGNDDHFADVATTIFAVILPLAAIFSPISAYLLDGYGPKAAMGVMAVVSALIAFFSVGTFMNKWFQLVTIVLVCFNRYMLFAIGPFILSAMFGSIGTGTVYGLQLVVAAAFNTTNYGWYYISRTQLDGSFLTMNIVLNSICAVVACVTVLSYDKLLLLNNNKH